MTSRPPPCTTEGAFPDLLPIGVEPDARIVLVYVARTADPQAFRTFVTRHTPLCRALPRWTLRLVLPRVVQPAYAGFHSVIRDE